MEMAPKKHSVKCATMFQISFLLGVRVGGYWPITLTMKNFQFLSDLAPPLDKSRSKPSACKNFACTCICFGMGTERDEVMYL